MVCKYFGFHKDGVVQKKAKYSVTDQLMLHSFCRCGAALLRERDCTAPSPLNVFSKMESDMCRYRQMNSYRTAPLPLLISLTAPFIVILDLRSYRPALYVIQNCCCETIHVWTGPYHDRWARPYTGCWASHQRILLPVETKIRYWALDVCLHSIQCTPLDISSSVNGPN